MKLQEDSFCHGSDLNAILKRVDAERGELLKGKIYGLENGAVTSFAIKEKRP